MWQKLHSGSKNTQLCLLSNNRKGVERGMSWFCARVGPWRKSDGQGVGRGAEGGCEAVELLEFAVFYRGAVCMVESIVVVKVPQFAFEGLSRGGLIYTAYKPAGRLVGYNSFELCIVVERHWDSTVSPILRMFPRGRVYGL